MYLNGVMKELMDSRSYQEVWGMLSECFELHTFIQKCSMMTELQVEWCYELKMNIKLTRTRVLAVKETI